MLRAIQISSDRVVPDLRPDAARDRLREVSTVKRVLDGRRESATNYLGFNRMSVPPAEAADYKLSVR